MQRLVRPMAGATPPQLVEGGERGDLGGRQSHLGAACEAADATSNAVVVSAAHRGLTLVCMLAVRTGTGCGETVLRRELTARADRPPRGGWLLLGRGLLLGEKLPWGEELVRCRET